jgi:hypothetical protein
MHLICFERLLSLGNVTGLLTQDTSYLQAVGADLEIRAVFPDGHAVKIPQFSE